MRTQFWKQYGSKFFALFIVVMMITVVYPVLINNAKNPSQLMNQWFALGPTHHFALSVGHNAALFEKVASLLKWPFECISL